METFLKQFESEVKLTIDITSTQMSYVQRAMLLLQNPGGLLILYSDIFRQISE